MKKNILFTSLLVLSYVSNAQINPCATVQKDFQIWSTELPRVELDPINHYLFPRAITYVPMHYHIVTDDNGKNGYPISLLHFIHNDLNSDFERNKIDIRFYLDTVSYIKSSQYFDIVKPEDDQLMAQYNTLKHFNAYLVNNPNGACGYVTAFPIMANPPSKRGGIFIQASNLSYDCSNPGNKTLPHEVGHWLNIYHTFTGWEGKGSYPPNLTTHPYSEWENKARTGSGANCATKGDGFCDTDPDYINTRWNCPYSGTPMQDPTGATISMTQPGKNFMSYSNDACSDTFTPQQRTKMLQAMDEFDERKDLKLIPVPNLNPIPNFSFYSPKYNSSVTARVSSKNFSLRFNSVPNATKYVVCLTKDPSGSAATYKPAFNFIPPIVQPNTPLNFSFDTIISDTFLNIPQTYFGLAANNNYYYWQVRAYNKLYSTTIPVQGFRVYNLNVTIKVTPPKCFGESSGSFEILDSSGITINYKLDGVATTLKNFTNKPAGNYVIEATTPDNNVVKYDVILQNPTPISATTTYPGNFTATLNASGGTAPYTYTWSNGKTGASQTGLAAGSYNITITDSKGCQLSEYAVKINAAGGNGTVGIQSVDISNLDLYPNRVQLGESITIGSHESSITMDIYDMEGKLVQSLNLDKSQEKFQWTIEQKGFFLVKIKSKSMEKTVKIESY